MTVRHRMILELYIVAALLAAAAFLLPSIRW